MLLISFSNRGKLINVALEKQSRQEVEANLKKIIEKSVDIKSSTCYISKVAAKQGGQQICSLKTEQNNQYVKKKETRFSF